jgi:GT2 family glycosyltransferase
MYNLGVIIVNYNNSLECISYIHNYLFHQNNINLQVVIVDNNSHDDSVKILQNTFRCNNNIIILKSNFNKGFSNANNIGLKYFENLNIEYILISNSDIILKDRNLCFTLIKNLNNLSNAAFISPLMLNKNEKILYQSYWGRSNLLFIILRSSLLFNLIYEKLIIIYRHFYYSISKKNILITYALPGSFFIGKLTTFKNLNYFDDNVFLYHEENILAEKVFKNNLLNYVLISHSYIHLISKTIGQHLSLKFKYNIAFESKIYYLKFYRFAKKYHIFIIKVINYIFHLELHFISLFFNDNKK